MKTHSKLKNTGILFELLVRQIASEIISNKDSNTNKLIFEYFSKDKELHKELQLYKTLIKEKFTNKSKAEEFLSTVVESRKRLDQTKLREQKYNLIKKIKENYNTNDFFKAKLPEYKLFASIYQLFEYSVGNNISPLDVVKSKQTIIEHISATSKPIEKSDAVLEEYGKMNRDVRLLAYKIMLESFNIKYKSLSPNQKQLLKVYINNITNTPVLLEHLKKETAQIKKQLLPLIETVTDSVVKIKLNEVYKHLTEYTSTKCMEDNLLSVMKYYDLVDQLKTVK